MAEGHLLTRLGKGTFVVPTPPCRYRFGLVIPSERVPAEWQKQAQWSHFWTVLIQAADRLSRCGPEQFTVYYGVSGHVDVPDAARLQQDLITGRLAGLILLGLRFSLERMNLPLGNLPCISLINERPAVISDLDSFFAGALDYLLAKGRRRIAVLLRHQQRESGTKLETLFERRGIPLPPHRKQFCWAWSDREGIANLIQLMLRGPADERPDGLIIADDHLVPDSTLGIVSSGLRVPPDLDVVAYANFPVPTISHVPALRRGFDTEAILKAAVALARQPALLPNAEIRIPAVNADELPHNGSIDPAMLSMAHAQSLVIA